MKTLEQSTFPNYIYDCRYRILKGDQDFAKFEQELEEVLGVKIIEWVKPQKLAHIELQFPEAAYH